MTENNSPDLKITPAESEALDVARRLIKAGVPVFSAPPNGVKPGHYVLPAQWQLTVPSETWLEKWRPGWALAAVGGHVCDFLDTDPRNGGHLSEAEMRQAGQWPRSFGRQSTPSGGTHDLISATGERKATNFMPGLDLQAGAPDGSGRGFVWIAPTVRPSKDIDRLGQLVAYRWVEVPDLDLLAEWRSTDGTVTDDSLDGLISRVHAWRAIAPERASPADSPFHTASTALGGDSRAFTPEQAQAFVAPYLEELRGARIGEIEEKCNRAAVCLSHFVPAFWDVNEAMYLLRHSLTATAYDPDGPSDWTVEKFRPVLDGRRAVLDPWKAQVRPEKPDPLTYAQPVPIETDEVDALLAEMLKPRELVDRPAPRPLVAGLLDLDSEAWLIGPPGSRKSFVVLDIAGHVATGRQWQNMRVQPGRVVMIVAEGATGFSLRVRAWEKEYGPMGDDVYVLPRPVQAGNRKHWQVLTEACRRIGPVLVVMDTQARVTVGLEENSATDMGVYIEAVRMIREATGACVLTVHHSGRNGTDARGSSAIDGAQGTELRVISEGRKADLRGRLVMDKQKDMAESEDGLRLDFQVISLGQDEQTGRDLSSLVLRPYDPFYRAQGRPEVEAWEAGFGSAQAQIYKVLRDQGGEIGLTQAETRAAMVARFYGGNAKALNRSTWHTAWTKALEKRNASGDPYVLRVEGSSRYVVDPSTDPAAGSGQ